MRSSRSLRLGRAKVCPCFRRYSVEAAVFRQNFGKLEKEKGEEKGDKKKVTEGIKISPSVTFILTHSNVLHLNLASKLTPVSESQ